MKIIKNIKDEELKYYKCISLDTEWTKNYKIKNGNKPFAFSIIFFNDDIESLDIINESLHFKFISVYVDNEEEFPQLINILNEYLDSSKFNLLLGHQVISDLHTFVHYSEHYNNITSDNILKWISFFKDRNNNKKIFDTRFDIKNRLTIKSRRLVDICFDMKIKNQKDLYKQPELNKSMTALHRDFIQNNDDSIREKLSVMNIRHNLSCILVYELYKKNLFLEEYININRILYKNLKSYFKYIETENFKNIMSI